MSIVHFKDLAEGIQALVLTLAVFIGGLWAIYRFLSLQEIRKAKADLDSLQKTLTERSTLSIELSADSIPRSNGNGFYISIKAFVVNVGNRTEILDWTKGLVEVAPVVGEANGEVTFGDWVETRLISRNIRLDATIEPSEKKIYPFLVPVTEPGVYYICLRFPSSLETIKETRKYLGSSVGDILNWLAEMYFVVS